MSKIGPAEQKGLLTAQVQERATGHPSAPIHQVVARLHNANYSRLIVYTGQLPYTTPFPLCACTPFIPAYGADLVAFVYTLYVDRRDNGV